MATLKYRDPISGEWISLSQLAGPPGPMGPTGPTGSAEAAPEEVAVQDAEPAGPFDLWVATGEQAQGTMKFVQYVGDGVNAVIPVVHQLGTDDLVVSLYDSGTREMVLADVILTDVNTVTLRFDVPPAVSGIKVVVLG